MDEMAANMKQKDAKPDEQTFLHIVMPVDAKDEDAERDEWEGMLKKMTRVSSRHYKSLGRKVDQLQKTVDEFKLMDS